MNKYIEDIKKAFNGIMSDKIECEEIDDDITLTLMGAVIVFFTFIQGNYSKSQEKKINEEVLLRCEKSKEVINMVTDLRRRKNGVQ